MTTPKQQPTPATPPTPPAKPGWTSTEFYKSLGFVIFLAFVAIGALGLPGEHWAAKLGTALGAILAAGWTVTNYTTNRTKLKK